MRRQRQIRQPGPAGPAGRPSARDAFTLVEILVVVAMIALVMSIILPGISGMFKAGSDIRARSVMSAMLGSARGIAIENQTYAAVHVQIGRDGKCWAGVLKYDGGSGKFMPIAGYPPRPMPGEIAFGEISADWVLGDHYEPIPDETYLAERHPSRDFTTFNVIFGPDGAIVSRINGADPVIETGVKIFGGDGATPEQWLWDDDVLGNEPGVRAMTVFDYSTVRVLGDGDYTTPGSRANWLEKNGQFLCVNCYTGKLLATR